MGELGKKGVSAVKWGAISSAGRFLLQMVGGIVLARILGPDIYGLFGMGMAVFLFSNMLADFGFGWSLVQKTDLQSEDIRFAITWQVMTGVLSGLVLYAAAPWLGGEFYRDERVIPVLRWLGLACLLNAAAGPATNLLRRDMNFRAIGLVQLLSYAVGYVLVGIPMALMDWGVTALVASWLSQSAVTLIGVYSCRPHSLKPLFLYRGARSMFNVGGIVFVTNVVNWWVTNLDRLLIGRLLNAQAAGLYNQASNLSNMPSQLLLSSLQPAFLAAGARMSDNLPKLREAYLQILSTIWALIAPGLTVMAVLAPDIIHLLYGAKWSGSAPVLCLLLLAIPLNLTWCMTTPVLWNNGRKHYESLALLPVLMISAWGFFSFATQGVVVAAGVAVASTVLRTVVLIGVTLPGAQMRATQVLQRIGRGVMLSGVLGGVTGLVAMPLRHWTQDWNLSLAAATNLMLGASFSAVLAVATVWRWPGIIGTEAARTLVRFVPKLSRYIERPATAVEG